MCDPCGFLEASPWAERSSGAGPPVRSPRRRSRRIWWRSLSVRWRGPASPGDSSATPQN